MMHSLPTRVESARCAAGDPTLWSTSCSSGWRAPAGSAARALPDPHTARASGTWPRPARTRNPTRAALCQASLSASGPCWDAGAERAVPRRGQLAAAAGARGPVPASVTTEVLQATSGVEDGVEWRTAAQLLELEPASTSADGTDGGSARPSRKGKQPQAVPQLLPRAAPRRRNSGTSSSDDEQLSTNSGAPGASLSSKLATSEQLGGASASAANGNAATAAPTGVAAVGVPAAEAAAPAAASTSSMDGADSLFAFLSSHVAQVAASKQEGGVPEDQQQLEQQRPQDGQQQQQQQTARPSKTATQLQHQIRRLKRSGRLATALRLSYQGMEEHPRMRCFVASAASLETKLGRKDAALALLDDGLARWPGNVALLLPLGRTRAALGDRAGAREAFRAALAAEPDNAYVLHSWGMVEAAAGDVAAARALFRSAVRAEPDMAATYTAWARMEATARRGPAGEEAARRVFEEGQRADPSHVPLLHAWARFELNHDKQSAARRLLARALELDPHHVPSWMALGQLEWRQGNAARAREVFELGLSLGGRGAGMQVSLLSALAELELGMKNVKRARELFERLRQYAPQHVPALLSAAQMEHRAGNATRAARLYDEAQAAVEQQGVVRGSEGAAARILRPRRRQQAATATEQAQAGAGTAAEAATAELAEPAEGAPGAEATAFRGSPPGAVVPVLHARAQAALRDGDVEAAERWLAAVESLEPGNGYLCHTRGLLCQREGRVEAAEDWFRRGLRCRGSHEGALLCYEGLAELLAFKGLKEEARAVWRAGAAAVQPLTSRYLRQAALFEKKERNWAAAAALFSDAVRRDPQDYRSWLQWAVFERRQRNFEAAERCFQRGTAVAPGYPYLWYSYATMLVALRRLPEARAVLQTATRNCPRSAPLWMEWALMEAAAGDVQAARRLFIRGSEVPPTFQHAPLYQAWADFERQQGDEATAQRLAQQAEVLSQAPGPGRRSRGSQVEPPEGPSATV